MAVRGGCDDGFSPLGACSVSLAPPCPRSAAWNVFQEVSVKLPEAQREAATLGFWLGTIDERLFRDDPTALAGSLDVVRRHAALLSPEVEEAVDRCFGL